MIYILVLLHTLIFHFVRFLAFIYSGFLIIYIILIAAHVMSLLDASHTVLLSYPFLCEAL